MYKSQHKRPATFDYDLIVIGTGAGGGVTAHIAASRGKKVALVEDEKVGGECPNYGCVPTKALLKAAEVYAAAKGGERFGIKGSAVSYDYPAIKAWKDLAVRHTGTEEGEAFYASEGVHVIHGHAHFINDWTVSVHGRRLTAHKFLIATGTRSVVPPIPGLKDVGFITYREAINRTKPPKSLFVLGGGAIGCEFAHLFNVFGTKVHVADMAPYLVGAEDQEVGLLLEELFTRRGMKVCTNAKVVRVAKEGSQKAVFYEKDGKTHKAMVEEILVASGKAPNTDLGLENAGVAYDKGGVKVNAYMQTTNKHIYAAGDIVGPYRFTHTASYQSRIAAYNMFHTNSKQRADYRAVPRCVFVEPEVACVGITEKELKARRIPYQTAIAPISIIGRANTSNVKDGFVKVIATPAGRLLGASIVSPRAGEVIHELTLAIQHRLTARHITQTIHAYPTWSEAVRIACQKIHVTP